MGHAEGGAEPGQAEDHLGWTLATRAGQKYARGQAGSPRSLLCLWSWQGSHAGASCSGSRPSLDLSSWGLSVLAVSLLPLVPACSHHHGIITVTPHHLPTRAHDRALTGCMALGWEPFPSPGDLPLTVISTNLRVNRARPVSKALQGHQGPLDRADLWGTRDSQGLWGRP